MLLAISAHIRTLIVNDFAQSVIAFQRKSSLQQVEMLKVIIICFTLLVIIPNSLGDSNIVYIKPDNGTVCPESNPCYTLQKVILDEDLQGKVFASNTEVILLPGIHGVSTPHIPFLGYQQVAVNIEFVSNLTICGLNGTVVEFYAPVRFNLEHVSNLSIVNIHFDYHCATVPLLPLAVAGHKVSVSRPRAMISAKYLQNILVHRVYIAENCGGIFQMFNISYVSGNCLFSNSNISIFIAPTITMHRQSQLHMLNYSTPLNITFSECAMSSQNTFENPSEGLVAVTIRNTIFTKSGCAINASSMSLSLFNVTFLNNHIAVFIYNSEISFYGTTLFSGNVRDDLFINGYGSGGINAVNSVLFFHGNILFERNSGAHGGAISLHRSSSFVVSDFTSILFDSNWASITGGAIYSDPDDCFHFTTHRLFKCLNDSCDDQLTAQSSYVLFKGNKADLAGDAIYAGAIDECCDSNCQESNRLPLFDSLCHFENDSSKSRISSDPYGLCTCSENNTLFCSTLALTRHVFPGEDFYVPVVAVGQRNGIVPATIYATLWKTSLSIRLSEHDIDDLQNTQLASNSCTLLKYTVKYSGDDNNVLLWLTLDMPLFLEKQEILSSLITFETIHGLRESGAPMYAKKGKYLVVYITFSPCPAGFVLTNGICDCAPELKGFIVNCSISLGTVYKEPPFWIGTKKFKDVLVYIRHDFCPSDYCISVSTNLNLSQPDDQCVLNRTGLLCGECKANMSMVFGSSGCHHCSSTWLLLILVFACIGIILVVLLLVLNLTVSAGSINGLILYVNLIRINRSIFFPSGATNFFLTILDIFVAWLNLDLGINTCFYNGLDMYVKTWLQLVFPLYIWTILLVIVIASYYSTTVAKLVGNNSVPALATLFLLSYVKILRVIVASFSFTILNYSDDTQKTVWLYDANVNFLSGKHIALFLAALILLVGISIPYTSILLFYQCLLSKSNHKAFSWVNKVKPLFDAYVGVCKDKHRYWPGLLLLLRLVLILVFSVNVFNKPEINLLATGTTILVLLLISAIIGGPYKKPALNYLEYFFILNILSLVYTDFYMRLSKANKTISTCLFIGAAFFVFVGVFVYHCYVKLRAVLPAIKCWKSCKIEDNVVQTQPNNVIDNSIELNAVNTASVPQTVVDFADSLREPLLDSV